MALQNLTVPNDYNLFCESITPSEGIIIPTTGKLAINNTTDSTSNTDTNASIFSAGGLSITKDIYANSVNTIAPSTFEGNLYLQRGPGGSNYRVLSMDGGNSQGFIFANFAALGDGIDLSYNYYYPTGSSTPVIPASGGGTSNINVSYGQVNIQTGNTNTMPTTKLTVNNTGAITASNGGFFNGPVTTTGITCNNSTVGYTPTTFNYFEYVVIPVTYTGPWSSQSAAVYVKSDGKSVTLRFTGVQQSATASSAITISPALATRFLPSTFVSALCFIIQAQNSTNAAGLFTLQSAGQMTIYATPASGTFTSGQVSGFSDFAISYTI